MTSRTLTCLRGAEYLAALERATGRSVISVILGKTSSSSKFLTHFFTTFSHLGLARYFDSNCLICY